MKARKITIRILLVLTVVLMIFLVSFYIMMLATTESGENKEGDHMVTYQDQKAWKDVQAFLPEQLHYTDT